MKKHWRFIGFLVLINSIVILLFAGCSKYADIEQEARLFEYKDCSYVVVTRLWVKQFGRVVTLEEDIYKLVKKEEIEKEKRSQLAQIQPLYLKVREILKNKTCEED